MIVWVYLFRGKITGKPSLARLAKVWLLSSNRNRRLSADPQPEDTVYQSKEPQSGGDDEW